MSDGSMFVQVGDEPASVQPRVFESAEIQNTAMIKELVLGRAQFLSATIRDFVRLRGNWWIMDRDIWFVVDDEELIGSLNSALLLMAAADERVTMKPGAGQPAPQPSL